MGIEDTVQASIIDRGGRKRQPGHTGFWVMLGVSIAVHVGGAAAALYAQPKRRGPDLQSAIPVQLVRLGKKRDPKLLPRKEQPPPPPPKDEGVALEKEDSPKRKPEKKTKKSRDDLPNERRRDLDSRLDRALDKLPSEEPEGDPNGVAGGTTSVLNPAQGYIMDVGRVIKERYRLPESIPSGQRQFLKARVLLYVAPNGRILEFQFVEEHPNQVFMGALRSLLENLQLPPPPAGEAKRFEQDGFEVIFRP